MTIFLIKMKQPTVGCVNVHNIHLFAVLSLEAEFCGLHVSCVSCIDGRVRFWRFDLLLLDLTPHGAVCLGTCSED